ncbi:MAG: hypothetical protein P0S95_04575 [Rhabdochlamydiaceae bacterium]|nr:hypothetical protein [Candidatus Amphrikana amoebophyrae]
MFGNAFIVIYVVIVIYLSCKYRKKKEKEKKWDLIMGYYFMWCIGFPTLTAFIIHAFYPGYIAEYIGWPKSPFQMEVALFNLAIGITSVRACFSKIGYRWAVALIYFIYALGVGINHIFYLLGKNDFTLTQFHPIFYSDIIDIITSLVIIILMTIYHQIHRKKHI